MTKWRRWVKQSMKRLLGWWSALFGRWQKKRLKLVPQPLLQDQTNVRQETQGSRNIIPGIVQGDVNVYQGTESQKPFSTYLCNADLPPVNYVERPLELQRIKDSLFSSANTLVITAVHGSGGIGKSVMAKVLCQQSDVREQFGDGILWVTLGAEPNLLPSMTQWIKALGDTFEPLTERAAHRHLNTLLSNKQMLLVVDDAWNADHVELFRVGGPKCRLLVTTREVFLPDAKQCTLELMTLPQSLEMLATTARQPITEQDRPVAAELAKALGFLPLGLELAAIQVKEKVANWSELLDQLQEEIVRLEDFDLSELSGMNTQASRR
ncbi:MAG: NB-ARC domain-containing protein, partial [Cyanobacteria bacterium J06636_28]